MTNYFDGCKTKEERKSRYYDLARKHHPDVGGDVKVMQEINQQFKETVRVVYYDESGSYKRKTEDRWQNTEAAKPCPFCGKLTLEIITSDTQTLCKVKCKHCGATGPETYTGQGRGKYTKWNMRN